MPLKKKRKSTFPRVFIWALIAILVVLMIVSFAPTQHMTEIVVYP